MVGRTGPKQQRETWTDSWWISCNSKVNRFVREPAPSCKKIHFAAWYTSVNIWMLKWWLHQTRLFHIRNNEIRNNGLWLKGRRLSAHLLNAAYKLHFDSSKREVQKCKTTPENISVLINKNENSLTWRYYSLCFKWIATLTHLPTKR